MGRSAAACAVGHLCAAVLADLRWEEGAPGWCLGSNNVSLIKQEQCPEPQTDGKLTPPELWMKPRCCRTARGEP